MVPAADSALPTGHICDQQRQRGSVGGCKIRVVLSIVYKINESTHQKLQAAMLKCTKYRGCRGYK